MTTPLDAIADEPFDWNAVGGECDALCEAIAARVELTNPMQTNENTMEVLEHLWDAGYVIVERQALDELAALRSQRDALAGALLEACRQLGASAGYIPNTISTKAIALARSIEP